MLCLDELTHLIFVAIRWVYLAGKCPGLHGPLQQLLSLVSSISIRCTTSS